MDVFEHTATVTFDDERTSISEIMDILEEEGYPAEGEPRFIQ
jgi:copper chaperone CopZ